MNFCHQKNINDIYRTSSNWPEEFLIQLKLIRDESYYLEAIELEKQAKYHIEEFSRFTRIEYLTKCLKAPLLIESELVSASDSTAEKSLNKTKLKVIAWIEKHLLMEKENKTMKEIGLE